MLTFINEFPNSKLHHNFKTMSKQHYCRKLMGVKPQKKGLKKSSCSRILKWQPVFRESQASNCTPGAQSLLLSSEHNPGLGGTILICGGTSGDLGGTAP